MRLHPEDTLRCGSPAAPVSPPRLCSARSDVGFHICRGRAGHLRGTRGVGWQLDGNSPALRRNQMWALHEKKYLWGVPQALAEALAAPPTVFSPRAELGEEPLFSERR